MKNIYLFVMIVSVVVSGCNYNSESNLSLKNSDKGIIEGSLSYPSHSIPQDLEVCANNVETKTSYCTQNHLRDKKYTYGLGYNLEVPAGNYQVYALYPVFDENGKKPKNIEKLITPNLPNAGKDLNA